MSVSVSNGTEGKVIYRDIFILASRENIVVVSSETQDRATVLMKRMQENRV
jgi:hypothetical protein